MLKFYFREALRNIIAGRPHSFLNILGLTLGLSCSCFLFKYVHFEWTTDRFHEEIEDIYTATIKTYPSSRPGYITPTRYFKVDYDPFPAVVQHTILVQYEQELIEHQDNAIPANVVVVDSTFAEVFELPLISGSPENILHNPQDLLIKTSVAKKLFGEQDPMGKEVLFKGIKFLVAGLLRDWPKNSSLDFDLIIPFHSNLVWDNRGLEFVRLSPGASIESLNVALKEAGRKHYQFPESSLEYVPFDDLYFDTTISSNGILRTGNLRNTYILLLAAALILGISLFNYINIFLALLIRQSKIFGVKKVFGAGRRELGIEIVLYNLLNATLAVWLAGILISYLTPWLQGFTNKPITLRFPEDFGLGLILIVALTLILSIYPLVRIPQRTSINLLQGKFTSLKRTDFRKWVIGIQFGISIMILIATLSFHRQTQFMLNRDLGIEHQQIIRAEFDFEEQLHRIPRPETNIREDWEKFGTQREEARVRISNGVARMVEAIEANPILTNLSFGNTPINTWKIAWKNADSGQDQTVQRLIVTPNSKDLFGFEVLDGRFFDAEKDKSGDKKVVINERAMEYFGFKDLSESTLFNPHWGPEEASVQVIGVVKDFYFQHLSHAISPLVMFYYDYREDSGYMMQVAEGKDQEALAFLQEMYEETNPSDHFTYTYFTEEVKEMYKEDQRIASIYSLFTFVGLIISALGLFSISLFEVQQRVKEIGIRKVNGASTIQIVFLLLKRFLRIIIIAFLIACPLPGGVSIAIWKTLPTAPQKMAWPI